MAHHQYYRSPFGDTTLTKVFVGGLAWETPTDLMRGYFDQFGEILEAVIITDKHTGKSKGYGFVTFREPESARRACVEPNPVIDGRRANCNIASLGRPRSSPPRGRNQVGNIYQGGGGIGQAGASSYPPLAPPPVPAATPPVIYPPYGYTTYPPDYGYHQAQYYNQLYGASSSSIGAPYYYGYSLQGARGTFPAQRFQGPSYLYYPTQQQTTSLEGAGSYLYYPTQQQQTTSLEGAGSYLAPPHQFPSTQPTRFPFPASTDSLVPPQTSTETEAGPATSTSSTA